MGKEGDGGEEDMSMSEGVGAGADAEDENGDVTLVPVGLGVMTAGFRNGFLVDIVVNKER